MHINPDYDVDVVCIWCRYEFTLAKKEIWYTPYICPRCGKQMGRPHISSGARRNANNIMVDYHEARSYFFDAKVPKSKLVKFIETVHAHRGYCHDITIIDTRGHLPWIVRVELHEGIVMEGISLGNPPTAMAQ